MTDITYLSTAAGWAYLAVVIDLFSRKVVGWSLKHEWTNHASYFELEEARLSVFKYIEIFYNPVRLHQTLGYLSPEQYEAEHAPEKVTYFIHRQNPPFLGHCMATMTTGKGLVQKKERRVL